MVCTGYTKESGIRRDKHVFLVLLFTVLVLMLLVLMLMLLMLVLLVFKSGN